MEKDGVHTFHFYYCVCVLHHGNKDASPSDEVAVGVGVWTVTQMIIKKIIQLRHNYKLYLFMCFG